MRTIDTDIIILENILARVSEKGSEHYQLLGPITVAEMSALRRALEAIKEKAKREA